MSGRRQKVRPLPHFEKIDLSRVEVKFSDDGEHRWFLRLPYSDRAHGKTLAVVGQNPSRANAANADKTVQYIERFVYENLPDVGRILILNLYSRIDTEKIKNAQPNDPDYDRYLRQAISENQDFLMIFGRLENKGVYRFQDRAAELEGLFTTKNVLKIDIGSSYAPHPGNQQILYAKFSLGLNRYNFADLNPPSA